MESKEKAKELVHQYDLFQATIEGFSFDDAKQCALIAVDEILKVAFYADDKIYNFYLEVKKKIEKL